MGEAGMIAADQLVAHAIGDYLLQSDWMANEKTKQHIAALTHAIIYSFVFLVFTPSLSAFAVILATHFLIDRYRLARYVVFAKNFIAPRALWPTWANCVGTGYPSERPAWLAVWLLIIADNVLHVVINAAALKWL